LPLYHEIPGILPEAFASTPIPSKIFPSEICPSEIFPFAKPRVYGYHLQWWLFEFEYSAFHGGDALPGMLSGTEPGMEE
jgi:hypothetical protein